MKGNTTQLLYKWRMIWNSLHICHKKIWSSVILTYVWPRYLTRWLFLCNFQEQIPGTQFCGRCQSPSLHKLLFALPGQHKPDPQHSASVHQCSEAYTGTGPSKAERIWLLFFKEENNNVRDVLSDPGKAETLLTSASTLFETLNQFIFVTGGTLGLNEREAHMLYCSWYNCDDLIMLVWCVMENSCLSQKG